MVRKIKIDNLKAGVVAACFYEPTIQSQYSQFLTYYQAVVLPCRVRRPQDKGKVESSIKYVKNNFLKGTTTTLYVQLEKDLKEWMEKVCNQRLHGTTRKIPALVFKLEEKACLQPLPALRYQFFQTSYRKVNAYGHVSFEHNFYSVPAQYLGERLLVQSNGSVVKIYKGLSQVALHAQAVGEGSFITQAHHQPSYKQKKDSAYYQQKAQEFGTFVLAFLQALQEKSPDHWHRSMQGIFHLGKTFEASIVNQACQRAVYFQQISYHSVKLICQSGLYKEALPSPNAPPPSGGFHHDLSLYDSLH